MRGARKTTTAATAATAAFGLAALLAGCGGGGLDAPSIGLGLMPPSIPLGNSSTLSWTSTGATRCVASGDWTGARPINGSEVLTPTATGTYNYTLSCSNGDAGSSVSTQLTVTAAGTSAAPVATPSAGSPGAQAYVGSAPSVLYLPDREFAGVDAGRGSIETYRFAADGSGVYQPARGKAAGFRWTGDAASTLTLTFAPAPDAAASCLSTLRSIRIARGSEPGQASRESLSARSCGDARLDAVQVEQSTRLWQPAGHPVR